MHALAVRQGGSAQCRMDVTSVEIPEVFVFFQKDVELKGLSLPTVAYSNYVIASLIGSPWRAIRLLSQRISLAELLKLAQAR